MAIWYEVEKNEQGMKDFLDCNWCFHDFRPESISFVPGKDMVEILLQFDTRTEGVLLRFVGVHNFHVNIHRDYEADWMSGSTLKLLENGCLIWFDDDNASDIIDLTRYTTWVEADRLIWAATDAEGHPIELTESRIDQSWVRFGGDLRSDFPLKPFDDKWEEILKPHW